MNIRKNYNMQLSTSAFIGMMQQRYLNSKYRHISIVNKHVSFMILEYKNYCSSNDNNHAKVIMYYKNNHAYKILYSGEIDNIPPEYENLTILPWNEEIGIHLKVNTLYIYINYDQSKIDSTKDKIERASQEEEKEEGFFRLFTKRRK